MASGQFGDVRSGTFVHITEYIRVNCPIVSGHNAMTRLELPRSGLDRRSEALEGISFLFD